MKMNLPISDRMLWVLAGLIAIIFHLALIFPLNFSQTPSLRGKIAITPNPNNVFKSVKVTLLVPIGELKEISPSMTKKVSKPLLNKKSSAIAQEGKNSKISLKKQPHISRTQEFKKVDNNTPQSKNSPLNSRAKDEVITAPLEGKDSVVEDTSINLSKQKSLIKNWQSQVIGHLSRFKKYPKIALDKNKEGKAIIYVAIDKDGQILSATLIKSTQEFSLDSEAVALFKRVSPLPKPPVFLLKNEKVEFILPIDFNLKQYLKIQNR